MTEQNMLNLWVTKEPNGKWQVRLGHIFLRRQQMRTFSVTKTDLPLAVWLLCDCNPWG
jgi:hypothetical protein